MSDMPHICESCGQLRTLPDLRVCEECSQEITKENNRINDMLGGFDNYALGYYVAN
jgi:hypothetical protein